MRSVFFKRRRVLTNDNMFSLERIPESLIVIGGGAIACEMAQAFARLGSEVTMIIRGPRLMWREFQGATDLLEQSLEKDGIKILREDKPVNFEKDGDAAIMHTQKGQRIVAERVLVAAGRLMDYAELKLDKAGIKTNSKGAIEVNKHLQTSQGHIYACGDCNGYAQFSHAAMHQGMIALMNSMSPRPLKQNFKKFVVPWTVFTEPQISHVGPREQDLKDKGVKFEAIEVKYGDYGAAIAENIDTGFVRALVSPLGRIYAATIVGEGSGDMINEWGLAVQKKIRMHDIMFLQHSFPTMGFLTKRASETWMMNRMQSGFLKGVCKTMYRFFS